MNINDVKVGDKFVTKDNTWFSNKDKICIVTAVNGNLVSSVFEDNPNASCILDFDSFNYYFTKVEEKKIQNFEAPRITEDEIDEILEHSKIAYSTVFDKCTVVSCQLPNGFVITESSACVSPENYDEEMGKEICLGKIKDKVWELEAYLLQQMIYEDEIENCDGCTGCHACEDCDGCDRGC